MNLCILILSIATVVQSPQPKSILELCKHPINCNDKTKYCHEIDMAKFFSQQTIPEISKTQELDTYWLIEQTKIEFQAFHNCHK